MWRGVTLCLFSITVTLTAGCGDDDGGNQNQNQNGNGTCGDGVLDSAEQCDDGVANSDSLPDACRSDCRTAYCGDAVADSAEDCDGNDLKGEGCTDLGYDTGTLACASDCTYDTSGCGTCGDGVKDAGEDCDGTDLGGALCGDFPPHQEGVLTCKSDCTLNLDQCYACGDGVVDGGEECDTDELNGQTCATLGYTWGTLACTPVTCRLETSGCFSFCGNGVLETGEQCDGATIPAGTTCADVDPAFTSGTVRCSSSCQLSGALCTRCGNGTLDPEEECDGSLLGGADCSTLGGGGGTLGCTADCHYDTSTCTPAGTCGNGQVDSGEQCDGANLDGESCATVDSARFAGGRLACSAACLFDTTGCVGHLACGNGAREDIMGERCDGADLGGETCVNLGFAGGALTCNSNCTLNLAGCISAPGCGDGAINGAEQCDGTHYGGLSCQSLGFALGGILGCTNICQLDTSQCISCGDGVINGGDICDGNDLGLQTCDTLGYDGGDLACDGSCQLDTSGCATCGNGILEPGEDCDGSTGSTECSDLGIPLGTLACGDNCLWDTSQCTYCGDGVINGTDQCDASALGGATCLTQGYQVGELGCSSLCEYDTSNCSTCGNHIVEGLEQCDDGDTEGGDGCSADCLSDETCGNGIVDTLVGEVCDDGGNLPGDGCSMDCLSDETCGNGIVDLTEGCEDGNWRSHDGCSSGCTSETAGWAAYTGSTLSPDERTRMRLIQIAGGERVLLFGGDSFYVNPVNYLDTWEFDGTEWIQMSPGNTPQGNINYAAAYDSLRDRAVIFGGGYWVSTVLYTSDQTWTYANGEWSALASGSTPETRFGAGMAYDEDRDAMVLYGGGVNNFNPLYTNTWELRSTGWVNVGPATNPGHRHGVALAYDPVAQKTYLFGGCNAVGHYDCTGYSGWFPATTWEWDGTDWTELTTVGSPGGRYYHVMQWDPNRQRIVLVGGRNHQTTLADTWEFDSQTLTWTQVYTLPALTMRHHHGAAFLGDGRLVLFGGSSGWAAGDVLPNTTYLYQWSSAWPDEACDNSTDDDGDGLADCQDPDCDGRPCNGTGGICQYTVCL